MHKSVWDWLCWKHPSRLYNTIDHNPERNQVKTTPSLSHKSCTDKSMILQYTKTLLSITNSIKKFLFKRVFFFIFYTSPVSPPSPFPDPPPSPSHPLSPPQLLWYDISQGRCIKNNARNDNPFPLDTLSYVQNTLLPSLVGAYF